MPVAATSISAELFSAAVLVAVATDDKVLNRARRRAPGTSRTPSDPSFGHVAASVVVRDDARSPASATVDTAVDVTRHSGRVSPWDRRRSMRRRTLDQTRLAAPLPVPRSVFPAKSGDAPPRRWSPACLRRRPPTWPSGPHLTATKHGPQGPLDLLTAVNVLTGWPQPLTCGPPLC